MRRVDELSVEDVSSVLSKMAEDGGIKKDHIIIIEYACVQTG